VTRGPHLPCRRAPFQWPRCLHFLQPLGISCNIQGGRESDFTLGLNWYPDKGIRFMANWVNVFQYSANFNRPDLNGIHPNLFVLRAQVDW
jgi:phosphate-selective porin